MSDKTQPDDILKQLKELMLGDEQRAIETLRSRLDGFEEKSVERLAGQLAEALHRRQSMGEKEFEAWIAALQGSTEASIQRSVTTDKTRLSHILFPVIGPAIRNYMVEMFRRMAQELNETIQNATSAKRIRWRFQARLAGKSYSEYVMLKTRAFRIEEVYLMQRETGLLLLHAAANPEEEATEEADLVSGMFTAIRSFVSDSFAEPDSNDGDAGELDGFTFGEREVMIEVGPAMVLAAVVHGVPTHEVRDDLKAVVEDLHTEVESALDSFGGDMSRLESSRPTLRRALIESQSSEEESGGGMWRLWLLLGLLLFGVGTWIFFSAREQGRWNRFEEALRAEPGIAVTGVKPDGFWRYRRVAGLRDPLAKTPAEVATGFKVNLEKTTFQFALMESLDPAFADRRQARMDETQRLLLEQIGALNSTVEGLASDDSVALLNSRLESALATFETTNTERRAELEKQAQKSQQAFETLVRSRFNNIDGLTITFEDGSIHFNGQVPEPVYVSLLKQIAPLSDVMPVDTDGLVNGSVARMDELEKAIAGISIHYSSGSRDREDDAKLRRLAGYITELDQIAATAQRRYRFVVEAHPLIGTNREANRAIERTRSQQVREQLVAGGIDAARIESRLSEDSTKAGEGVTVEPVRE